MGLVMMPLGTHILNSAPRELVSRVTSLTSALRSLVAGLTDADAGSGERAGASRLALMRFVLPLDSQARMRHESQNERAARDGDP